MKYTHLLLFMLCNLATQAQTKTKYDILVDSLTRTGQTEKIIPYFEKEIKANPKNEQALRWLGYLHIEAANYTAGEKYYNQALALNPKCAPCYRNLGRIYAMQANWSKSITFLTKAIEADPAEIDAYLIRGKVKEMDGDKFAALFDFDKAAELAPKNTNVYIERGSFNARQGYASLAMGDFNKAIELEPKNYYPYFKRASSFYDRKMYTEAMADMATAMQLDSSKPELYTGRGAIYAVRGDHAAAIRDYTKAIALRPSDYFPYYNRALEHYAREDMDAYCTDVSSAYVTLMRADTANALKAELEYLRTTFCDSGRASYYYQRGIALYNLGHYDKAVAMYNRGLQKFPTNSMMLSFRGNAHFALKNYEKALPDYAASIQYKDNVIDDVLANQKHTQLDGGNEKIYVDAMVATTYLSVAESEFALGRYTEALASINKGIALAPESIKDLGVENYYNVRGNILLALGKYQQAYDDFEKSIRLKGDFALAYINRAIARINIDNKLSMTTRSISGGMQNEMFNANWQLPAKNGIKKSDVRLLAALADCDKALTLDAKLAYGYYIRGQLKKILGQADYCYDLIRANELSYPVEAELLGPCKK